MKNEERIEARLEASLLIEKAKEWNKSSEAALTVVDGNNGKKKLAVANEDAHQRTCNLAAEIKGEIASMSDEYKGYVFGQISEIAGKVRAEINDMGDFDSNSNPNRILLNRILKACKDLNVFKEMVEKEMEEKKGENLLS